MKYLCMFLASRHGELRLDQFELPVPDSVLSALVEE